MAVRFVIGRAGCGKTRWCVEGIASALAESPLGPPLLWVVPEQATFSAERLLLAHEGVRGSFRAQVMSFRRLAHVCAMELGLVETSDLDDLARIILLGDLVGANRKKLELFEPIADRPGFVTRLDDMLRELQQSAHTGASLRELAEKAATQDDAVLPRKLRDLGLLLDAWDAEVQKRKLPTERLMETVAGRLGEMEALRGARVWVDGFSAFNTLEGDFLAALAQQAAHVAITLTGDPLVEAMRDPRSALHETDLFHRTQRVYHRMHALFLRHGVAVEDRLALTEQHRLGQTKALRLIEQRLFEPSPRPTDVAAPPEELELWECSDPLVEVQAAAQAIRRMVKEGLPDGTRLRYRDVALVIPALEHYADAVRRVFAQHGIPHFVDQRRSITHHPLIEFLRSAVALPLKGFATDDVCLLLKTGLTGFSAAETHHLENYLLAHGMTHHDLARPFRFVAPNQHEEDDDVPATAAQRSALEAVNATREGLYKKLRGWLKTASEAAAAKTPPEGHTLVEALWKLVESFNLREEAEKLIDAARAAADAELVLIHTQAWRRTVELFETMARVLEVRPTTLEEFEAILATALESMTLGLIPPTVDQVLVSSVTRSRHPELKVAIVLGAVESRFPLVRPEDPLLNDHQRTLFNNMTDNGVNPGSDGQLLEAAYFDYVAFTRAGRRLIVSYPLADEAGKAITRSQYVARLQVLFKKLEARRITPETVGRLENLCTLDDALSATLRWARQALREETETLAKQPLAAVYQWLATHPEATYRTAMAQVWPALAAARVPALDAAIAARLYPGDVRLSVSQLEKYAACPLQYFMYYTLGLRPRPVLNLDVLQLGTLYHRIMEVVYQRIIAGELAWPECTEADLRAALVDAAEAAARDLHAELASNTPGYAKVLARARYTLGNVLEAQRRAACAGVMRPAHTELTFGMRGDDGGRRIALPVLRVPSPHGRAALLNGKIDRVDVAPSGEAVVVDYKSGSEKKLRLSRLVFGLELQLPVYLLVLQELGEALREGGVAPVGSFFVPMQKTRRTVHEVDNLVDAGSDDFFAAYKPRGVLDADAFHLLDASVEENGTKSQWYAFSRTKKDGSLAKGCDGLESDDFAAMLAFTRLRVGQLVDELAEGNIAPAPYQDGKQRPCDLCDFASVCTFDQARGQFRPVPGMGRDEALDAMHAALEGHDG